VTRSAARCSIHGTTCCCAQCTTRCGIHCATRCCAPCPARYST
jgi:hypothetical protein